MVRTGSAPGGCPMPRALAETRREFGQDYKEGAAVWYAVVAGADRATTGLGTARASSSACFTSTSACQRADLVLIAGDARASSVMETVTCLPVLYLLITLPTSTPTGPAARVLPIRVDREQVRNYEALRADMRSIFASASHSLGRRIDSVLSIGET